MQRLIVAALAPVALCLITFFSGCGGQEDRTSVAPSAEAKKADAGAQSGMQEYMKSKGGAKSKPGAK